MQDDQITLETRRKLFKSYMDVVYMERFSSCLGDTDPILESVEDNLVIISLTVTKSIVNGNQNLHGAAAMLLLDDFTAIALFVHDPISCDETVSIELTASYYYPAKIGERVYLHCNILKEKGNIKGCRMDIKDEKNKILVSGRHTMFKVNNDKPFLKYLLDSANVKYPSKL
eukprot:TRINITY_DN9705_c0_g1_i1.p1 TRINITY_DN9705_c0_g1~~TRINITY_DN9705_c0_g1_i1.p1  ORF type:complete len:171 (-),score=29.17 TRINITY_DN9705_c0_g1_i1:21-533(-)